MTERNYYVLCDDNCRFEGMTKEQIFAAIAETTGITPTPVDEAFITKIKEQNGQNNLKFWKGTEAQYNAIETKDNNTLYIVGTNKLENKFNETIPVERGGTGATEARQARRNLGINIENLGLMGAETKLLLWENASPTSAFEEQTIELEHSNFTYFEILYKLRSTYPQTRVVRFAPDFGARLTELTGANSSGNYLLALWRNITESNGNIQVGAVTYAKTGSIDTNYDNTYIVPWKIYGVVIRNSNIY